jgi:alpha-glucosidase
MLESTLRRPVSVLFAVLCAGGCGDDLAPLPVEVTVSGLRAVVWSDPAQIELFAGDQLVWSSLAGSAASGDGPPHAFVATRSASAAIEMQYGSFRFDDDQGDSWRGVDRLVDVTARADGLTFTLVSGDTAVGTGELVIEPPAEVAGSRRSHAVRIRLSVADSFNRLSLSTPCAEDEHFAGLGGQSFDVDHRGQTVPLWVQEDGIGKEPLPDQDYTGIWFLSGRRHSTHTPMPMLLSSRGYAMAVDTDARTIFALCSEADDVTRVEVWAPVLDLRLFVGPGAGAGAGAPELRAALGSMIDWVGRPERPPLFAFAPWLDAVGGEENVQRVADRLRAEGIAASAVWTEDWRGGGVNSTGFALEEDWRVDRALYPDLEGLAAELEDLGFAFLSYQNSFVDQAADVFDEAVAGGYLIEDADGDPYLFEGVRFEPTGLLDLTNQAAVTWAQDVFREGIAMGVDGWMADFAEWLPTDAVLGGGTDALGYHNRYPVDWARLNRDLIAAESERDGVPRLFFVRAAWLGSQPLVSVVWAGDQQTDFSPGDGYPSVIPIGIGLGVTGFPYFGHDIAGYMSQGTEPTSEELWQRWVTLGALSPVMRTHHGRSIEENHSWESDAAAVAHMRRWTRLHMQLVPYLWGSIGSFERDGLPLFRLVALEWPGEEWAWTVVDQYLLGDRILVAPVVEEGAVERAVELPPGRWHPLLGGPAIEGGRAVTALAPPTEIPAFVPDGALVVLYPDGVDTVLAAPGAEDLLTAAEVGPDREVWLWPGQPTGGAGQWNDEAGPAGAATWEWSGRGDGVPTSATWNGEPVDLSDEDGAVTATVVGDGELVFAGGGTLTITRGHPDAAVRVRLLP